MPEGWDVTRTGMPRGSRDPSYWLAGTGAQEFDDEQKAERRPFDWAKDAPELKERDMSELSAALSDTLTMGDISDVTGFDQGTLHAWARRNDDYFPKAIPGTAKQTGKLVTQQRWRWKDILDFVDNRTPLKRGRRMGSGTAPTEEESTPKPYDPEKDVGRNLQEHIEVFQGGGINPDFKWPQKLQQGWFALPLLHGIAGEPAQLPVKTADPRPVEKTMPTEIPESEEHKAKKDQRRKIEGTLEESKKIDEGRDVEGRPGKKFW